LMCRLKERDIPAIHLVQNDHGFFYAQFSIVYRL